MTRRSVQGMNAARWLAAAVAWSAVGAASVAPADDDCSPRWVDFEGPDRFVQDLLVHDDGSGPALFIAGNNQTINGGGINNAIAKWDGQTLTPLLDPNGLGIEGQDVTRIAVFDSGNGPELIAAGQFWEAGSQITSQGIAKWDGTAWEVIQDTSLPLPLSNGGNPGVRALFAHDDGSGEALYALGGAPFTFGVGPDEPYSVARWDGVTWHPTSDADGSGPFRRTYAGAAFDDGTGEALYISGISFEPEFDSVKIARWDGVSWTVLPDPPGYEGFPIVEVSSLVVFDDGDGPRLFAGLAGLGFGGPDNSALAAWNGTAWDIITDQIDSQVRRLRVIDDGAGQALFVMGEFRTINGELMNGVARWDGSAFTPLADDGGTGVGGGFGFGGGLVWSIASFNAGAGTDLYLGGVFTNAGGIDVVGVATWDLCVPGPCVADLEPDGVLDLADLVAFVTAFTGADPLADFAEPEGVFDLADIVAFVAAFNAGCP
jgi:hypothetical protein